jgi:hypothetical protein
MISEYQSRCGRAAVIVLTILCAYDHAAVAQEHPHSVALDAFLEKFDVISERGYIPTMRAGDTGVGYTLESLLELEENNFPRGDFMGMEIKAYRDTESEFNDQQKMNVFLKEPVWVDGYTSRERLQEYGYRDAEGRQAWYLSVTNKVNEAGLQLQVREHRDAVDILRHGQVIGSWATGVLGQRLTEKHSQSVFVAAAARGKGSEEEFWYRTVTWCCDPSIERFMKLVDSGDVILELRMHARSNGSVRNHGTAFRVKKHRLKYLFAVQEQMRPASHSPDKSNSVN